MPTTYDVVLLIEQALTSGDAERIASLHTELAEPVRYHLLLPVDEAAAGVEAAMGSLGVDGLTVNPMLVDPETVAEIEHDVIDTARRDLASSVAALEATGSTVLGRVVDEEPVAALAAVVTEVEAAEVIILTQPHLVAGFFHVDWTSRARRKLGVPVLHLIEHETFAEQAGGPDGISGA